MRSRPTSRRWIKRAKRSSAPTTRSLLICSCGAVSDLIKGLGTLRGGRPPSLVDLENGRLHRAGQGAAIQHRRGPGQGRQGRQRIHGGDQKVTLRPTAALSLRARSGPSSRPDLRRDSSHLDNRAFARPYGGLAPRAKPSSKPTAQPNEREEAETSARLSRAIPGSPPRGLCAVGWKKRGDPSGQRKERAASRGEVAGRRNAAARAWSLELRLRLAL